LFRIKQAIADTDAKVGSPRHLDATFGPAYAIVPPRARQSNHPRPNTAYSQRADF